MRNLIALTGILGFAFAAQRGVLADSGEVVASVVRPQRDIACDLRLSHRSAVRPGSPAVAKIVVRNKGKTRESGVTLAVYANTPTGTPLWTDHVDLRAHRRKTRKAQIDVPAGTTSLVAVAFCDGDGNAGNNYDSENVGGLHDDGDAGNNDDGNVGDDGENTGGGGSGGSGGSTPYAVAGAATYASSCASCHGADARGTRSGPSIVRRSANSILEAVREGDDGMPRFPGITRQDAQNLAAFLADPSAATPPAPTPPPPTGQTPTYATDVQPILAASCAGCHTGTTAPLGIRLDTYGTASANSAVMLDAMQMGRMPIGNPLPAATIQVIADWIAGGKQP
jgi:cytochrome c553